MWVSRIEKKGGSRKRKAVVIWFSFQTDDSEGSGGVNELGLLNVGGIFLVLLLGIVLGLVMAAVERIWDSYHCESNSNEDLGKENSAKF